MFLNNSRVIIHLVFWLVLGLVFWLVFWLVLELVGLTSASWMESPWALMLVFSLVFWLVLVLVFWLVFWLVIGLVLHKVNQFPYTKCVTDLQYDTLHKVKQFPYTKCVTVTLVVHLDNQSKFFTRRFVSEACPLEAKSIKPCYALYRQLPRAILLDMF
jgi:hypothetical protein